MTMKEIEERSGMTRANIRYYESEGLLSPKRTENGYRDYSEEDLKALEKIKLLRSLQLPLEDIKSVQCREKNLAEVLEYQLKNLSQEKENIEFAQKLCQRLKNDCVKYETLDAKEYLNSLTEEDVNYADSVKTDKIERVMVPWRRFFARMLDLAIYETVFIVILFLVFRVNLENTGLFLNLLMILMNLLLVIIIEPVLISNFGTTIGKAILGLSVKDYDKSKLSYKGALERTVLAMWSGMGFLIPFYSWIRLWKSYMNHKNDEMEWERNGMIFKKDKKFWHISAYIGAELILCGILFLAYLGSTMPVNRGNLTVAEFSENFNQYAEYYGIRIRVDETGKWESGWNSVLVMSEAPTFVFTEKDGLVSSVELKVGKQEIKYFLIDYEDLCSLAFLSYVKAQNECSLFDLDINQSMGYVHDNIKKGFEMNFYGVDIIAKVDVDEESEDAENQMNSYYLKFTMEK